jgi:hypothetical protein
MQVNTFAEVVNGWVEVGFRSPLRFTRRRRKDGEFEAAVRAPQGSKAGGLAIVTWQGDLWVRFTKPNMWYPVDSREELLLVVRHLLKERALFATTYRGNAWRGVTLIQKGQSPKAQRGEMVRVVSWSGRYDSTVKCDGTTQSARKVINVRPNHGLQPTAAVTIMRPPRLKPKR